ncbi:hypothetical protein LCM17_16870 [Cereibacter sphaeroides]|nr:hypothetical protein [Cereibacter sphaeroides]
MGACQRLIEPNPQPARLTFVTQTEVIMDKLLVLLAGILGAFIAIVPATAPALGL